MEFYDCPIILGIIIPTDEHICPRVGSTTNQMNIHCIPIDGSFLSPDGTRQTSASEAPEARRRKAEATWKESQLGT